MLSMFDFGEIAPSLRGTMALCSLAIQEQSTCLYICKCLEDIVLKGIILLCLKCAGTLIKLFE
jgi:hypothetical protein